MKDTEIVARKLSVAIRDVNEFDGEWAHQRVRTWSMAAIALWNLRQMGEA